MERAATCPKESSLDSMRAGCGDGAWPGAGMSPISGSVAPAPTARHSHQNGEKATSTHKTAGQWTGNF
jgi:hypothetical protein